MDTVNKLLLIPASLLFLIILEISISSLIIHQNTSDLISNSTMNSEQVVDCYNYMRRFNFWYGVMSCVNLVVFTSLVVIFYILEYHNMSDGSLGILILVCLIEAGYFITGVLMSGISLFPGKCELLREQMLWIITCVTFSLSISVAGIAFLTCLGSMCNEYMNADD